MIAKITEQSNDLSPSHGRCGSEYEMEEIKKFINGQDQKLQQRTAFAKRDRTQHDIDENLCNEIRNPITRKPTADHQGG